MKVKVAKWYSGASSPVTFMIDDLANVYIDVNGNNIPDPGEDWGHFRDQENSTFNYLKKNLLDRFPKIKTTFFVPLDRRPLREDHDYNAHFGPINESPEIEEFFRKIHNNEKFEIAYHGLTHGISGTAETPFVQEWLSYETLDEALNTISKGREMFFEVFKENPVGGKYCGYARNSFSDESIDKSGFYWWCRFWDRVNSEFKDKQKFMPRYFGENNVIDIPTTLAGNLFLVPAINPIKQIVKKIIGKKIITKESIFSKGYKQIDSLLRNRQVISVQEHIAPSRTDGKRQGLNIFDDMESLLEIFSYLSNKNVWYATCSQIAQYFEFYSAAKCKIDKDKFNFEYTGRNFCKQNITLIFSNVEKPFKIESDNGVTYTPEVNKDDNTYFIKDFPAVTKNYKIISV